MPRSPGPSEPDLQSTVLQLAAMFGWHVAHFRAARTAHGWATPVAADGKGWPDLVLVHAERGLLLFRELKSEHGRLTAEQLAWAQWLRQAGLDYDVWRPRDLDAIADALSFGKARAKRCAT